MGRDPKTRNVNYLVGGLIATWWEQQFQKAFSQNFVHKAEYWDKRLPGYIN